MAPPDHVRHQHIDRGVGRRQRAHVLPVAHDRDLVAEREHLLEEVRHVDRPRCPRRAASATTRMQLFDLLRGERGRRLVHDDHPGVAAERPQDLDLLLLGHRQRAGERAPGPARSQSSPQRLEPRRSPRRETHTETRRVTPQEDVLGHREVRREGELLLHDRDAGAQGVGGRGEATGLPSTSICPASGRMTPLRILPSVDLPAPFSPTRPWTFPGATEIPTSSRARWRPKDFTTPRAARIGVVSFITRPLTCPLGSAVPLPDDLRVLFERVRVRRFGTLSMSLSWTMKDCSGPAGLPAIFSSAKRVAAAASACARL